MTTRPDSSGHFLWAIDMQEDTQLPATPPLSGPDLVDKSNKAFQTIASDFYGDVDPMSKAWPGSVWAHPAEGVYKRLNDAGSAWVVEGRLFKSHLPMYLEADIPTTDIGDIYVIGKGTYTWRTSAYSRSGIAPGPIKITRIIASGTWTPDPKATSAEVEIWGGGGGGGVSGSAAGGTTTFAASGITTMSAGGGNASGVTETSTESSTGGDLNLAPPRGIFIQVSGSIDTILPGRDAPRGGPGGSGDTARSGSAPGGGGATVYSGPIVRYGAGAGGYVYKFLITLPASATVTIGSGGAGDYPGARGECIIKEYGSL